MKLYKRKTIEDLYRVAKKYWSTSDTDYLDAVMYLSQKIDNRVWCEIHSLVDLAVRTHKGVNVLIEALRLFGYEVEDDRKTEES